MFFAQLFSKNNVRQCVHAFKPRRDGPQAHRPKQARHLQRHVDQWTHSHHLSGSMICFWESGFGRQGSYPLSLGVDNVGLTPLIKRELMPKFRCAFTPSLPS